MSERKPVIRSRSEHKISRRDIDEDALKVLYRLSRSGYTAYLVGGGVRDLLLGRRPKDFDIATDAHPNQIRKLFRNAFLIGRRFRLAHIKFGTNIIETSTFRKIPEVEEEDDSDDLVCRQDNTFGTPEEDAHRRDFTVNALFYDIRDFSVIDHVNGLTDLRRGLIRCIGDPEVRFSEDPVRMVRAVRFAARLGFKIERRTRRALEKHHDKITLAAAPRMLEEIGRLFPYGSGHDAFRLLDSIGLLVDLFPELRVHLKASRSNAGIFWGLLGAFDDKIKDGLVPDHLRVFSVLLYPLYRRSVRQAEQDGTPFSHLELAREVIEPVANRFRVPRRVVAGMTHVFEGQRRFEGTSRRFSKRKFARREIFPETLLLRELYLRASGGDLRELEEWNQLSQDEGPSGNGRLQPRSRSQRGRRRRSSRRTRGEKSQEAPAT